MSDKTIVCDKCNAEFPVKSVNINECSVEVEGKVLLLTYFVCPECNSIYRVLLVDEAKYRTLVNDLLDTKKRIRRLKGKGNPQLLEKLQQMASKKSNRIQRYVQSMNKQYHGTFTFVASENNQKDTVIKYLP